MSIPREGCLLRVFISESDQWEGRPLHEAIVLKARKMHLAGATVLRGVLGYGASSKLHTSKVLRLSEDLPVVVEIVDDRDKLEEFLLFLDQAVTHGMATLERAEVIWYR